MLVRRRFVVVLREDVRLLTRRVMAPFAPEMVECLVQKIVKEL